MGQGEKAEDSCYGFVRNTNFHRELGKEGGRREPERVVTQPGLGVLARSGFLPFCKCARLIENDLMFVTESLLNLEKVK